MSHVIQLDLFQDNEITKLEMRMKKTEESCDKVRKGIYAKHGDLRKKYDDLQARLEILERNLCYGK